jgi:S-adenosylmethionine synthetase, C-terminal domain
MAKPTSVSVDTMGTQIAGVNDDMLSNFVSENFALTPRWITNKFGLDKPGKDTFLYAKVAAKGQVGNAKYPWEKLDAVDTFKALIK